ncbi:putative baseplate hub protein [Bacillus phage vB_BcgM]|nr:putative baseplate hub protein [Bacillus phage vB_BcgM]
MKAKELTVTVLAIIGMLSILNYVILVAPGIINLLFWIVVIIVSVLSYSHFANKKKNQNKSEDK